LTVHASGAGLLGGRPVLSGSPQVGARSIAHLGDGVASPFAGTTLLPTVVLIRPGYAGIEPSLGIDPAGRVFVNAVFNNGIVLETRVLRSGDQGAIWKDVTSRVGPLDVHAYTNDPYLYVDPVTGRVFHDDLILPCQLLSSSGNGGKTWRHSVVSCDQADHQTIFAGPPTVSRTFTYPNVVYDCAVGGGALTPTSTATTCDRSIDGGRTFTQVRPPYLSHPGTGAGSYGIPGLCDGGSGHGFVGPDGTVYLPRGWCGQPWLAMSRDEGIHWKRVQISSRGMPLDCCGVFDHEAGAVADAAGNVYYFWVARDRLPYLAVSRDRGSHWGAPIMVGPPGLKEASLPAISIGAAGKLAMAYMGSTNSPGRPFPNELNCPRSEPIRSLLTCPEPKRYETVTWNGYVTTTTEALTAVPTFVTSSINPPSDPLIVGTCGPIRCGAEYDFIDVEIAPDGTPWAAFIDGCTAAGACIDPGELIVGHIVGEPNLR
jgi:hypothetical protein